MSLGDTDVRRLLIELARSASSRTELWIEFLTRIRPEQCVEIGVWKGAFAAQVLDRCSSIRTYWMVDPWRKLDDWNKPKNADHRRLDQAKAEALRVTEFASDRRTVLQGTTLEVVDSIPDASLDFIYIDGDHSLRGITIDLISLWPKLKPGGILAGDDFARSVWQHGPQFEPTGVFPLAVYFAEAVRRPLVVLPFQQFAIIDGSDHRVVDTTGEYADTSLLGALRLPLHKRVNRWARQRFRVWAKASDET